jgi:hypothetical protein
MARRVRLECLEAPLNDTAGSWLLGADGQWTCLRQNSQGEHFSVQNALMSGGLYSSASDNLAPI